MAEWLVERGIGEDRAILTDGADIIATRVFWHDEIAAGHVYPAQLKHRTAGSNRGTAILESGQEVLVDKLPREITEGSEFCVGIKRASIAERGRLKLPQGRVTASKPAQPDLTETLRNDGTNVREVRRFPVTGWQDIVQGALAREVSFAGGTLRIDATPAMTVIDLDGTGSANEIGLNAVPAIADIIRQFDLGGVIAVDFPTIASKAERRRVDDALDAALDGWPHERTAMNGFGLVQLVARLERPSLVHRALYSQADLLARQLLRSAERVTDAGAILLTVHQAIQSRLTSEWIAELAKRTGREIRVKHNPLLAIEASFAQVVPL